MTEEHTDSKSQETPDSGAEPVTEAENASPETFTLTRAQMERMEAAAKELEQLKDQFVRQAAEYDNYRKRTAREKESLWQDAKVSARL